MERLDFGGELVFHDEETLVHRRGERVIITHVEDIEPIIAETQLRAKDAGDGFSKGRTMRYLGSVPLSILLARPELADPNELKKYLRTHPRLRSASPHSF